MDLIDFEDGCLSPYGKLQFGELMRERGIDISDKPAVVALMKEIFPGLYNEFKEKSLTGLYD